MENQESLEKDEHKESTDLIVDIPQPKKIKVDHSVVHSRGVFATEDIEPEELIERCPMVPLEHRTKYHNDPQLYRYLYTHKCPCIDCTKHGSIFLMVLGYGMIYNHQDTPNTVWNFKYKEGVAEVVATRPIKKGEEIFVSYGESYFNGRKKVTLEGQGIKITESPDMPLEWRNWIKENLGRGVTTEKIKEILVSHKFDICLVEEVLGEKS